MKVGYARVSSISQDLTLQIEGLKAYGCEVIFQEKMSGKNNDRSQLNCLLERVRAGDIVVVSKIDRLARSLKGLIQIIEQLNSLHVNLVSLDSGDNVDTTTPMGKAFFQIAGVFAELERGMINERTKAGIVKARENGVKFGRVAGSLNKSTKTKLEKIQIYLKAKKPYAWIAQELHVSFATISNVKRDMLKCS